MKKLLWVLILSIPLFVLTGRILASSAEGIWYTNSLADQLSFVLFSEDGSSETIRCWEDADGDLQVFLPSYASMSALTMKPARFSTIRINGKKVRTGMDCSGYMLDTDYSITDGRDEAVIRFLKSANVATMYIETQSGAIDRIHEDKSHKESAGIRLFTEKGELVYRGDGLDRIRGHGNSTWKLDKRPYNLYLSGAADLLGLGRNARWVLLANGYDATALRNKVVLDLADKVRSFDRFAPHTDYVDLYLNGEYAGLYLLAEHVAGFDNHEVLSDGGTLFTLVRHRETYTTDYIFTRRAAQPILPDQVTESYLRELEDILLRFNEALLSEDPEDLRWMAYTDIDSWVRKYLIEEITMNNDAGAGSQYFIWNDLENRVYAGPCWDYDDILGDYLSRSPRSFLANREWEREGSYTPWFHELLQKPAFQEKVRTVYREEFLPELEWLLETGIQQYAQRIDRARFMDTVRWEIDDAEEVTERMVDYLKERVDFLNSAWIEGKSYHTIMLKGLEYFRFYSAPDGEDGSFLPSPDSLELPSDYQVTVGDTWYYEDTGEPFDPKALITEDITLFAKTAEIDEPSVLLTNHSNRRKIGTILSLLIMILFLGFMVRSEAGRNDLCKRRHCISKMKEVTR
ncbi:MAG: CotH kinase family protein [Eubacterium sp.]|nr:CotH kinase family protein [Eubacterium sp.]